MITKVIDNFGGRLIRDSVGDMNSGLAKYATSFGYDPFGNPGNLTWLETATQIDPSGAVITDLIMAGKERVESGISYVYAIGHLGRLYKIQINRPSTYNPNYDNPVLLATLSAQSPTFTAGGYIDFFGTTERIYVGHDKGVTRIDFDGTNETFIGSAGSYTASVPRPFSQFLGKLYFGNGSNIGEIDTTNTVTSYTKLSPGFPSNAQVRDIDLSSDGVYLEMVVSRLVLPDLTSATQDTNLISNSESYIFKWNGTDTGYTSFQSFPSFSLNSNIMFGRHQYTFGYDLAGAAVFNPTDKILSPVLSQAPLPNAVGSNGNLVGWGSPEYYNGFLRTAIFLYGALDSEIGVGWWRHFAQAAQGTETDVIRVPFNLLVSNFLIGTSTNGYAGNVVSNSKLYFSTLETSSGTTKYKLYKYFPVPTTTGTALSGVYETQNQTSVRLFRSILKKKLTVSEIRVYGAGVSAGGVVSSGWLTNNSFKIDLIGADGNAVSNGSYTFTVGSTMTAGKDSAMYNPQMAPQHSLGVRVTNLGSQNFIIDKIEVDIDEAGK